ncbi:MAG: acetyl-CoA C-acyltransferase, partial [Bdellovibrionota bacterium]
MKVKGYSSKNQGIGATFEDIYIIDGRRTPFGKMKGTMSTVSPTDLAIMSSKAVIKASGVEASMIDQTIAANICAGSADAFFLPRHIALYAGAPMAAPAVLAQRICGSGIEVIGQAAEQI